jgi:hypothetical protein
MKRETLWILLSSAMMLINYAFQGYPVEFIRLKMGKGVIVIIMGIQP